MVRDFKSLKASLNITMQVHLVIWLLLEARDRVRSFRVRVSGVQVYC